MALKITFSSPKVTNCYLMNGCSWYHSEIKSQRGKFSITFGNDFFQQFFHDDNNYNLPFENVFISRCFAFEETHYFEHNEPLVVDEINLITQTASELHGVYIEINKKLEEWYEIQMGKQSSTITSNIL